MNLRPYQADAVTHALSEPADLPAEGRRMLKDLLHIRRAELTRLHETARPHIAPWWLARIAEVDDGLARIEAQGRGELLRG